MQNNFQKLELEVLKILKSGRPNWDIPHTLASVYWMARLLEHESGIEKILISTMYLHDIGYSMVGSDFTKHEKTINAKFDHMRNGVIIAKPILEKLNYDNNEIEEILNLIGSHDDLNDLSDHNKQLVFEADSLGQVDIKRAKSSLEGEELKKFVTYFEKSRVTKFKTKIGIEFINKLFPIAKEFYLKHL